MIFKELNWIHTNSNKFCPFLRKAALEWYRSVKYIPCFLQKFFRFFKQRLYKIPVIVQVEENQLNDFSIKALTNDTGIYNHPDLTDRIIAFKDLVNQKAEPYDDNGHGTHVAGDIAASGEMSGYKYRAPTPEAGLVGVKVLNKIGSGSLSVVIEGIQWCIKNKEALGIRVINMSLGSDARQSYIDDPVCQIVEKAWKSGIVVCVAAGNSGPESGSIGSPAIHPEIITVGALDDMNTLNTEDDNVAEFSSRGPTNDGIVKPDVVAPGAKIISLRSPGSLLDKQNKDSRVDKWYTSLSGTSMATPICSGIVAQMLQQNSALTPNQVKARLMETATVLPNLDPNTQGAGVINIEKAVDASNVNESVT